MKGNEIETRPLRICLLGYRSNPHSGGQGVYIKNLSRALKDLGHRVHVVSGPPYPDLDTDIPLTGLPSLDLYNPENMFRMPSAAELRNPVNLIEWLGISSMGFTEPLTFGIRARRYVRARAAAYDIVHDNQCLSYGIGDIARLLPTLATIHHPITIDRKIAIRSAGSIWRKIQKWRWHTFIGMQQRVARRLSHILTVSSRAREDISRDFGIPEGRIRVVPNGIDTERFHPLSGVDRERNSVMVTNSADVPLKGLCYLLRAIAEVAKSRPVKLVVVGSLKANGMIARLIQELGIAPLVMFTGRIPHETFVLEYARAAMAVVPSVYEGFGLPAGEAMACGVPVISTTGGALPEVVGNAGILVPPRDPVAIARAILFLLDNPDRAAALGRAGYERVMAQFTWRRAAEKTVSVYQEVRSAFRSSPDRSGSNTTADKKKPENQVFGLC